MACDSFAMTMWINIEDLYTVRQLNIVTGVIERACFLFADLMASESMWTGAIRSNRNFTISKNGLVGCFGNVNFRVISLCKEYKPTFLWTLMDCRKSRHVCTVTFCQLIWPLVPTSSFSPSHTHTNMQNTHQLFHIMQIKNTNTLLNTGVWHFLMQILQCLLWKSCQFWLCTSGSCYTEASLMCVYSAQSFSSVLLTRNIYEQKNCTHHSVLPVKNTP